MTVSRELDDITRGLVRHSHEHPPVRDVNQEVDRRMGRGERIADDLSRVIGSWTFVFFQAVLLLLWLLVNLVGFLRHWDGYPFHLLNLLLTFQAAFAVPIVLMTLNRAGHRDNCLIDSALYLSPSGSSFFCNRFCSISNFLYCTFYRLRGFFNGRRWCPQRILCLLCTCWRGLLRKWPRSDTSCGIVITHKCKCGIFIDFQNGDRLCTRLSRSGPERPNPVPET